MEIKNDRRRKRVLAGAGLVVIAWAHSQQVGLCVPRQDRSRTRGRFSTTSTLCIPLIARTNPPCARLRDEP